MRKKHFLLFAALCACAALGTSCSNDVVSNDVDSGVSPLTKSFEGAYQVKTVAVTRGVNTENITLTYGADGKVTNVTSVKAGATTSAAFTYTGTTTVKAVAFDPGQGEDMRYTYTLTNGFVTMAEEAYDSDGYLLNKLKFVYTNGQLTAIQYGEENEAGGWDFTTAISFAYDYDGEYTSVAMEGLTGVSAVSADLANFASFDLNLYNLFGVRGNMGSLFNYAVLADLFPNTANLMTSLTYSNNNNIAFAYTQDADLKTTACAITTTAYEEDDEGEITSSSETVNVTLGY